MAAVGAGDPRRGPRAPLNRVIYTESHDEVANGLVRVPEAISPGDAATGWRGSASMLGSALVLTSPGIPMLFQGQELLEDRWFDDTVAARLDKAEHAPRALKLHRDLIALRRGGDGATRGLRGPSVAIRAPTRRRSCSSCTAGRTADRTTTSMSSRTSRTRTTRTSRSACRRAVAGASGFNSDALVYAPEIGGHDAFDADAVEEPADGLPFRIGISVGPYSVVDPVAGALSEDLPGRGDQGNTGTRPSASGVGGPSRSVEIG